MRGKTAQDAIAKAVAELTTDTDEGTTIAAVFRHLNDPHCFWDDMEDAIEGGLIAWRDHRWHGGRWDAWLDGKGATERLLQVPSKDVRLHIGGV